MVPYYKELTVCSITNMVKNHEEVMKFLPELEDIKKSGLDRKFLFTVVNT